MNEDQANFLKAAKEYEQAKETMAKAGEALQEALVKLPLGSYLQDPESGLVYKTQAASGQYVVYKKLEYVRTAKEGERQGSLSKKEASQQGFSVG